MTDTSADAQRHIDQLATLLGANLDRLSNAGARAAKAEALRVAADLGPMSNMGRRGGVRLRAGYDVAAGGASFAVNLRPPGAWVIAERGAGRHTIRPRRRRQTASGRPPALAGGGLASPVARVVNARARGRRGITRAFGRARAVIPDAIHAEQLRAMRGIFGG
jgi:hypothetical protein